MAYYGVKQLLMLVLCAALAAPAFAQLTVTTSLELQPATTIPELPVAFLVTITNPTSRPVVLANAMSLRVTPSNGDGFLAAGIGGRTVVNLPRQATTGCGGSEQCVSIPPSGQLQLYINYGPTLDGNEFFSDRRLSQPGTYSLQLILFVSSARDLAPVSSGPAAFVVQSPSGVDVQALDFLNQHGSGGVWSNENWALTGDDIAPLIRANYPTSTYATWVAALGRVSSPTASVANLDAALATNPTPSLRDNLLWAKGAFLAQASVDALYAERDVDSAIAEADAARTTYKLLSEVAISDALRQLAMVALSRLYTPDTARTILRQLAAGDPAAPAAVVPRVECVTPGAGQTFRARFGYTNPNSAMKVLQVGNGNEVTPAPREQGQPRVFKPGSHSNVFTASSPGGELKWHLDGNLATATRDFATQCTP